jgi:hypothetical protein
MSFWSYLGIFLYCIKVNFVCQERKFWPLELIKIYDVVSNGKLIFDLLVFNLKSALEE